MTLRKKRILMIACAVMGLAVGSALGALVAPTLTYPVSTSVDVSETPTFTWNQVPRATWYRVWVSRVDSPNTAVINEWVEGATSYPATTALTPGQEYSWWIQAWNSPEGYGPWSAEASFTPARMGYLMLGAPAFNPYEDAYAFWADGGSIQPKNNSYAQSWFAPVNLPQGATLRSMEFFYHNEGDVLLSSQCYLQADAVDTNTVMDLAELFATDGNGYHSVSTSISNNPVIDNTMYSYSVLVNLPGMSNVLKQVLVTYEY